MSGRGGSRHARDDVYRNHCFDSNGNFIYSYKSLEAWYISEPAYARHRTKFNDVVSLTTLNILIPHRHGAPRVILTSKLRDFANQYNNFSLRQWDSTLTQLEHYDDQPPPPPRPAGLAHYHSGMAYPEYRPAHSQLTVALQVMKHLFPVTYPMIYNQQYDEEDNVTWEFDESDALTPADDAMMEDVLVRVRDFINSNGNLYRGYIVSRQAISSASHSIVYGALVPSFIITPAIIKMVFNAFRAKVQDIEPRAQMSIHDTTNRIRKHSSGDQQYRLLFKVTYDPLLQMDLRPIEIPCDRHTKVNLTFRVIAGETFCTFCKRTTHTAYYCPRTPDRQREIRELIKKGLWTKGDTHEDYTPVLRGIKDLSKSDFLKVMNSYPISYFAMALRPDIPSPSYVILNGKLLTFQMITGDEYSVQLSEGKRVRLSSIQDFTLLSYFCSPIADYDVTPEQKTGEDAPSLDYDPNSPKLQQHSGDLPKDDDLLTP